MTYLPRIWSAKSRSVGHHLLLLSDEVWLSVWNKVPAPHHSVFTGCMPSLLPNQQCESTQHMHTHTHPFNGPLSGTTWVSRYQKGKTNLDFTDARDSEWQWHQLGHMQVCTSLQTDNHASTPPLSFLQAGCPSCHPTNSIKALKAKVMYQSVTNFQ